MESSKSWTSALLCVCMYSGEVSVHGLCQNQIAPLRATSRALIVSAAGEDERKWAFIHWALKRAVNNQPNGVARMMGPGRRSRVVRRSWKRESARGQLPQRLTECLGPLNTHTHTLPTQRAVYPIHKHPNPLSLPLRACLPKWQP